MIKSALNGDFIAPIFHWAEGSHRRALTLLAFVALLMFLPGFFTLQPMDRDEPRFAQASKQMLETGDFVSIRFQDEARNKKPVGIYWLQAASVALAEAAGVPQARQHIWLYRLPSLLAAISATCLTYWAALAITDRRRALIAGLLMASCLLLGVEARLAKTDAVLTATVIACSGVVMRLYLSRTLSLSQILLFWVSLAIGILIKGPLTPLIIGLSVAVLSYRERSVRWLRPLRGGLGLALCLAVVSPWFVLIGLKTHGAFFSQSIEQDMLGKVAQGQESHGAPPLTYFALFWITAWPMAPLALLAAPVVWFRRHDPKIIVLLAWLLPAWLMFELVPTKLPHYVLPLYPAIAILVGAYSDEACRLGARWLRRLSGFGLYGVPLVLVLAGCALWLHTIIPVLPLASPAAPSLVDIMVMLFAGGAGFCALYFSRRVYHIGNMPIFISALSGAAFCFFALAYSAVLTSAAFAPFDLSQRLVAARAEQVRATGCPALATISAGFAEPSFVFLTETGVQFGDGPAAAAFLKAEPCRLALVNRGDEPAFLAALGPQAPVNLATRVEGLNLGSGKRLDIGVYVRQ